MSHADRRKNNTAKGPFKSGMVSKPVDGLVWNDKINYESPVSSDKHITVKQQEEN